jgi:phytanoyl-CoA hydroxylase
MLSEDQIDRFHRDGFVLGDVVLDDDRVEELRGELDRVIADRDQSRAAQPVRLSNLGGDDDAPVWQVVNIWRASPAYRLHLGEPTIVEEIAQLTGAHQLRVWHDQIQYKPPHHGGVNHWHQDAPLWPPIEPMTQVTAWMALDDVDASNGCMSMVAGSHLWGDRMDALRALAPAYDIPENYEGHPIEVRPCPVPKGAVHYHHCLTWHGSHANTSTRPRRAIAVHYMTEETRYVAGRGDHPMEAYVEVADGYPLKGDAFPLVYDQEAAVAAG